MELLRRLQAFRRARRPEQLQCTLTALGVNNDAGTADLPYRLAIVDHHLNHWVHRLIRTCFSHRYAIVDGA